MGGDVSRCKNDGYTNGWPIVDDEGILARQVDGQSTLYPIGSTYTNYRACNANNSGATLYQNGEFEYSAGPRCITESGSANDTVTCPPGLQEGALTNNGKTVIVGNHPQGKRIAYKADPKRCIFPLPADVDVSDKFKRLRFDSVTKLWATCDPAYFDKTSKKYKEFALEYCSNQNIKNNTDDNDFCKTFCSENQSMCIDLIRKECATLETIDMGYCKICSQGYSSGEAVGLACNDIVQTVCRGNNLKTLQDGNDVCSTICFGTITNNYDCKANYNAFCSIEENQTLPQCQCYLPTSVYDTYYANKFSSLPDPTIILNQIIKIPYCSYGPCSSDTKYHKFNPDKDVPCGNQQICISNFEVTANELKIGGNLANNLECSQIINESNTTAANKSNAPRVNALIAKNFNDLSSTEAIDFVGMCTVDVVRPDTELTADIKTQAKAKCTSMIERCTVSESNLDDPFCQKMMISLKDTTKYNDVFHTSMRTSLQTGVNYVCGKSYADMNTDGCKFACFSEDTAINCDASMENICKVKLTNGKTKYADSDLCQCFFPVEFYYEYFKYGIFGNTLGTQPTDQYEYDTSELLLQCSKSRTDCSDFLDLRADNGGDYLATYGEWFKAYLSDQPLTNTNAHKAIVDYMKASVFGQCSNSDYYPRSMNPYPQKLSTFYPMYNCIYAMRKSVDDSGKEKVVYINEDLVDGEEEFCNQMLADMQIDVHANDTIPVRKVEFPEFGPLAYEEPTSITTWIIIIALLAVVIIVTFILLRKRSMKAKGAATGASDGYEGYGNAQMSDQFVSDFAPVEG